MPQIPLANQCVPDLKDVDFRIGMPCGLRLGMIVRDRLVKIGGKVGSVPRSVPKESGFSDETVYQFALVGGLIQTDISDARGNQRAVDVKKKGSNGRGRLWQVSLGGGGFGGKWARELPEEFDEFQMRCYEGHAAEYGRIGDRVNS